MNEKKANKIATEIKKLLIQRTIDDKLPMDMNDLNEGIFVPIIMETNTEIDKAEEIKGFLIDIFDKIGIDTPSNFDEIAQFCYDDVCASADPVDWHDGDVAIAFRRWIQKDYEN